MHKNQNFVVRSPQFEADLTYFRALLAQEQKESDSFDDFFGYARTNLAYARAMKREMQRVKPARTRTWAEEKAERLLNLELKRYQT